MVEWKKLGELSTVQRGKRLTKKLLSENEVYPVYHGGIEPLGYFKEFNRLENTVMVINVGASAGSVGFSNQKFWSSDGCFCISHNKFINNKYLYFFLLGKEHYLRSQVRYAGIPTLDSSAIEKIQIPIPPLSEQNRIVGILDTFTESIENLKKQISERKKQYAYLIDKAFGGSLAEMKKKAEVGIIRIETLSSHGTFTRGRRFVRTDIIDNGQPCIHYGDMYTYYGLCADKAKTHLPYDFPKKMRYAKKGDVVIVAAGENNEDIGVGLVWQGEDPAAVHDACFIYESDFEPMFLSYFLRSSIYHLQIKSNVVRGKICSISSDGIGKALIPIYPIDKQKEIVENLYPYEKLFVNLQAQLELRQKQYEYYRNKLLTFD